MQVYEKLKFIVLQRQVVADLSHIYTTLLEVFHSVKIRCFPKFIFFNMEKMIAGTQLAILDHNLNVDREQETSKKAEKEGNVKPIFCIAYGKPTKRFVAKKEKVAKDDNYLVDILSNIITRVEEKRKITTEKRSKCRLSLTVAPSEREDREVIIELSIAD
ncbi:uncharacterized protein LOC130636657 [Hydractinia symbiolongicarpus]|uniref:uncharacterized protein LOC130636657 n=1 Tax=Hydractinia symbiolongicarpus TaxID=13093 RepID=UPI00254D803E|nr:uncharacterized protein LOC130636657 [Hydractinia symbiolongicarpus]